MTGTAQQYLLFLRVFMADWRGQILPYVLFLGGALPVGLVWLLSRAVGPDLLEERGLYFLSGAVVTSVVFSSCSYIVLRVGWARHQRQLDFWASLPVSKLVFVLALLTVGMLTSVPGLLALLAVAPLFLPGSTSFTAAGVAVLVLGALSLSGIAAVAGTVARDGPQANMLENLLQAAFIFLAPTYMALSELPAPIRAVSHVVPTRYVAQGVRDAFSGSVGPVTLQALAVLTVLAVASLLFARWHLDWRSDGR